MIQSGSGVENCLVVLFKYLKLERNFEFINVRLLQVICALKLMFSHFQLVTSHLLLINSETSEERKKNVL